MSNSKNLYDQILGYFAVAEVAAGFDAMPECGVNDSGQLFMGVNEISFSFYKFGLSGTLKANNRIVMQRGSARPARALLKAITPEVMVLTELKPLRRRWRVAA